MKVFGNRDEGFRISMSFMHVSKTTFIGQVIKVPKMGDSISEGTVQTFVKSKLFVMYLTLVNTWITLMFDLP